MAGFRERFRGASESLTLLALLLPLLLPLLLLVYAVGAERTEPLVEWAGSLITSTRSTESRYSFESVPVRLYFLGSIISDADVVFVW